MADTFDTCLDFTLREEGGYVDDDLPIRWGDQHGNNAGDLPPVVGEPKSRSNPGPRHDRTNRQGDLPVALLEPLRADALPAGVDLSVFDMGVNAGIWGSARLLQRAVGFTGKEVDGCIGPETLAAAGKWDPRTLVNDLAKQQLAYYRTLSDFPTFGTGCSSQSH